jgi:hypothetical protein
VTLTKTGLSAVRTFGPLEVKFHTNIIFIFSFFLSNSL